MPLIENTLDNIISNAVNRANARKQELTEINQVFKDLNEKIQKLSSGKLCLMFTKLNNHDYLQIAFKQRRSWFSPFRNNCAVIGYIRSYENGYPITSPCMTAEYKNKQELESFLVELLASKKTQEVIISLL